MIQFSSFQRCCAHSASDWRACFLPKRENFPTHNNILWLDSSQIPPWAASKLENWGWIDGGEAVLGELQKNCTDDVFPVQGSVKNLHRAEDEIWQTNHVTLEEECPLQICFFVQEICKINNCPSAHKSRWGFNLTVVWGKSISRYVIKTISVTGHVGKVGKNADTSVLFFRLAVLIFPCVHAGTICFAFWCDNLLMW